MEYRKLANTDLNVSAICLGTMTYGDQNTQAEAFEQLDYAVANGINFIDTAEMYPVPPKADTYTRTETIIGHWLKNQARDKIVLGGKVAGPRRGMDWIRGGPPALDRANIRAATGANHLTGRNDRKCDKVQKTVPLRRSCRLRQRCWANGLMVPWRPFKVKKWSDSINDTMLIWSDDYQKRISLDRLCRVLGVPSPKAGGFSGADVWPAYQRGELERITQYAIGDVIATRECWKRMK